MHVLTEANFYNVIKWMYGPICDLLNEQLESAKTDMKLKPPQEIGSWCRAVTLLLYVIHKCQRGKDKVVEEELYQGTSRAAEGYSTEEAFTQAKEEGLTVAIHWQDADSSAATAIRRIMPETRIMKCLGHVGRAHNNQLEAIQKKKSFMSAFINKHKKDFPEVQKVKCECEGKNHTYAATPNRPACRCPEVQKVKCVCEGEEPHLCGHP